jgi:hypothetical protein
MSLRIPRADLFLCYSLIAFTDREPRDYMIPSRWGTVSEHFVRRFRGIGAGR